MKSIAKCTSITQANHAKKYNADGLSNNGRTPLEPNKSTSTFNTILSVKKDIPKLLKKLVKDIIAVPLEGSLKIKNK